MSFQDELNEILRLSGLPPRFEQLDEAAPSVKRLAPMFQNILAIAPRLEQQVEQEINWARTTLEREDRVVWYLRLVQLALMEKMTEADSAVGTAVEKKINQLARKAGVSPGQVQTAVALIAEGRRFKQSMTHYLSMPIQGIQNYTFTFEMPQTILDIFEKAEEEWKEDQKRVVDADDGAIVLIQFDDGVAWWDLERASCPQEAACMGHCGNSPRSHTDDTILSLRKEMPMGNEMKYSCMLTFILKSDGQLTEMKGRGNDKPAERYHKYIVPLLRHDRIEGIVGGGYMPENNFSLNDLEDEDLRQQLIDEKPGLAGPTYFLEKHWEAGNYEEAAAALEELADDVGLHAPGRMEFNLTNAEKGMYAVEVHLESWSDYESVVRQYDDEGPWSLFQMYEDMDDLAVTMETIENSMSEEFITDVLFHMTAKHVAVMAKDLDVPISGDAQDMARQVAHVIFRERENNKYYDHLLFAIDKVLDESDSARHVAELKEEVVKRLIAYAEAGIPMRPHQVYVHPEKGWKDIIGPEQVFKEPWVMSISMQDLMGMVEAMLEGDPEGGHDEYYDASYWSSEGLWADPDYFGSNDHRGDYSDQSDMDLATSGEKDKLAIAYDNEELTFSLDEVVRNAADVLSAILRTGVTPATDVSRQTELPFEAVLEDIRRLAGLS